jgi:hypothetical protein
LLIVWGKTFCTEEKVLVVNLLYFELGTTCTKIFLKLSIKFYRQFFFAAHYYIE